MRDAYTRRTVRVICKQCGDQFRARETAVIRGNGKFCSKSCYGAHISLGEGGDPFVPSVIESRCIPVPESGCWLWLGRPSNRGYGTLKHLGAVYSAHRAAWRAYHGEIPEGLVVMHACDTPLCVNPQHLRIGTQAENVADRWKKGRVRVTTWAKRKNRRATARRKTGATVTAELIASVHSMRHLSQRSIATKLSVSIGTVNNIINGKRRSRENQ